MSKTINELTSLYQEKHGGPEYRPTDLNQIFKDGWNTQYQQLFSTAYNDYLAIAHPNNSGNYITYKLPIAAYEAIMHNIRYKAISADLSTQLALQSLAWRTYESLELSNLAHQNVIYADTQIVKSESTPLTAGAIEESQICTIWGTLHEKDHVTDAEIDPSKLTLTASIKGWGQLALSSKDDLKLGDLASKNEASLKLSALASKYYVDLSWHPAEGATFTQQSVKADTLGRAPVFGKLDWKFIDNYVAPQQPAADTTNYGIVKLGYETNGRNYAVNMVKNATGASAGNNGKIYVTVPWSDTVFNITDITVTSNDANGFSWNVTGSRGGIDCNGIQTNYPVNFSGNVNITPQIYHNVVLSSATNIATNEINDAIPVFVKSETSEYSVTIKPRVQFNSATGNDRKYLNEKGNWVTVPNATTSSSGLMTKDNVNDLTFLMAGYNNNTLYKLYEAKTNALGGICVTSNTKEQVRSFEEYSNTTDMLYLPVKLTTNNEAFVKIPKSVGDPNQADTATAGKIAEALNAKFDALYPPGSLYFTTANVTECPLKDLIPGSVWKQVFGKYILASGQIYGTSAAYDKFSAGQTATAGLPSHSHSIGVGLGSCGCDSPTSIKNSHRSANSSYSTGGASNSIYGNSTTVRPPAFVVNVFWRES